MAADAASSGVEHVARFAKVLGSTPTWDRCFSHTLPVKL